MSAIVEGEKNQAPLNQQIFIVLYLGWVWNPH